MVNIAGDKRKSRMGSNREGLLLVALVLLKERLLDILESTGLRRLPLVVGIDDIVHSGSRDN